MSDVRRLPPGPWPAIPVRAISRPMAGILMDNDPSEGTILERFILITTEDPEAREARIRDWCERNRYIIP